MPTTQPVAGDLHVSRPLTNFSQKYLQDADMFVGLRAMPSMPVDKETDLYWTFDRDDFFRDEAEERADGDESSGGSFTLTTVPFAVKFYAHHKDVTDRQRRNQDQGIQLDQTATEYVTEKLMIKRETLFASTFMSQSIWTTDFSPSTKWEGSTSTPISEIRTAKRTIHQSTGKRANRILFGRQAYDTLLDNDDILARISGGATVNMPAMVMRQRLAELLEVDSIYVADGIKTTSVKGAATPTRAFIASADDLLVYHAPDTVGLNAPTAGIQFNYRGMAGATPSGSRIRRFRLEEKDTDRIEGDMAFAYQVVAPDLGYYIYNVTT